MLKIYPVFITKLFMYLDVLLKNPQPVTQHHKVERSLLKILRLWGGVTEVVPLGDRWKKPKEIPIDVFGNFNYKKSNDNCKNSITEKNNLSS